MGTAHDGEEGLDESGFLTNDEGLHEVGVYSVGEECLDGVEVGLGDKFEVTGEAENLCGVVGEGHIVFKNFDFIYIEFVEYNCFYVKQQNCNTMEY